MKRLLLSFLLIICFATTAFGATMGLYFDYWPGRMAYAPEPFSFFDVYLYLHGANYFVTALEYSLIIPGGLFVLTGTELGPNAVVELGDPLTGHSLAFWPPLSGFDPGYNMICKYQGMTIAPCGAGMYDVPLVVGPHPASGQLWGTYFPENNTFPIIGLTSILCPELIGVEETNWGAIKDLYR